MDQARAPRHVSNLSRDPSFRAEDSRADWSRTAESFPPSGLPRDPAAGRGSGRESGRPLGAAEPFDQRLERWVSRGRDLVDGVSGARPGVRGAAGAGAGGVNPNRLGRWVEERLDWLLDDAGEDDWREPWQESETPTPAPARQRGFRERGAAPVPEPLPTRPIRPRRGLEAISRRSQAQAPAAAPPGSTPSRAPSSPSASSTDDWPDEASFSLNRWQRPLPSRAPDPLQATATPLSGAATPPTDEEPPAGRGRPLPRSTRRR